MSAHDRSALHGEDPLSAARRKGRVAAAGHTGDAGTVRAGLADDDAGVRAAALAGLLRRGEAGLDDVEQGLADPSPAVRRRAAELAWRVDAPQAELAAAVSRRLEDEEGEVVEAVCFCLGELRPPGVTALLAAVATAHSDPLCRESAVAALGAIGEPDALPFILEALGDRPPVRRRAVLALASYDGLEVDAALERALEDRDWQVRQAAEDLSGARGRGG